MEQYCSKCGTKIEDGSSFCPACGQPAGQPQPQAPTSTDQDIAQNKGMAILSYFGILALIPYFGAKESKFAQFHAKQGMKLFICWIGFMILSFILNLIRVPSIVWGLPAYATPWYITLILTAISIGIGVLAIMGIVNAATGKYQKLPIIDKIKLFD